jgi:hypothetical protein
LFGQATRDFSRAPPGEKRTTRGPEVTTSPSFPSRARWQERVERGSRGRPGGCRSQDRPRRRTRRSTGGWLAAGVLDLGAGAVVRTAAALATKPDGGRDGDSVRTGGKMASSGRFLGGGRALVCAEAIIAAGPACTEGGPMPVSALWLRRAAVYEIRAPTTTRTGRRALLPGRAVRGAVREGAWRRAGDGREEGQKRCVMHHLEHPSIAVRVLREGPSKPSSDLPPPAQPQRPHPLLVKALASRSHFPPYRLFCLVQMLPTGSI